MEQVIREIAERLGFEAARIWPQVVAITWLTSMFWVIADVLLFVGAVVGLIRLWRFAWSAVDATNAEYESAKKKNPSGYVSRLEYDPTAVVATCAVVAIGLVFLAVTLFASFPDNLAGVIYPEAQTVIKIARGVKP